MKLLALLFLSFSALAQEIPGSRIVNESIREIKLHPDALRPISSGVLSSGALTFDEVKEVFTKTVDADLALTLGSGNVAYSQIILNLTGDGTHIVTWPVTWDIEGTYNPSATQTLTLDYNGTTVTGKFTGAVEIVEVTLTLAEVTESTTDAINLTFSNSVIITQTGWSVDASGDAVTILGVVGSGTAIPIFSLSRNIVAGETVTISYDPGTGATTSLTGNELETITNQAVTVPDPPQGDACPGCTIYFDDDAVDDIATGAIGDPFKTIQAAVNAAVSGSIIGGRAGTYRETVVAKTNVTIRAYTGEDVYISGFDLLGATGWTVHSGNIYKKTVTLPVNGFNTSTSRVQVADPHYVGTTIMANQILRNGVMMPEARWPNITTSGTYGTNDLFMRSKYRNGINSGNGFNTTQLTDATFPIAAPGLNGATLVSNGWFSQDPRTLSGHSGNVVNYSAIWDSGITGSWFRWRYYLTGKLGLLDAEAEWHYESGTLYFWQPGGGTPTGTIVYKARNYGIDARGKQNVTIIGVKFIGCDAFMGDATSTGATLDRIESILANHYVRHDVIEWQGVGMAKQFGIKLLGANSVIKNSIIHYSAGTALWLGESCRAENNLIHDVGYAGYWGNGISLWGTTGNQVITRNTIYRTGRSGFDFGYNFGYAQGATTNPTSYHFNVELSYNDISYSCLISSDGGGSYTWGQCDLNGLNYHHNWIHDIQAREQPDGGINVAIYFDQATGTGRIHHNVTWNCVDGDLYHETTNDWRPIRAGQPPYLHPDSRLDVYNNTFWNPSLSSAGGLYYSPASYRSYVTGTLDIQRNNIYRIPIWLGTCCSNNGNTSNSILSTTNPLFVGSGAITNPQDYFQLQSGSPARNIGLVSYAGVTGQITGHIDAGAYPYNDINSAFIPGYIAPEDEVEGEGSIDDASSSNTYTGVWSAYSNLSWMTAYHNQTIHVTADATARVSSQFTGDHIEWWSEKRNNHGIVQIWVDGVQQDSDAGTGGIQNYDLYDASTDNLPEMIFQKDVTQGNHTIEIRATGTRNASGVGNPLLDEFVHDRFFFETTP